MYDVDPLKVVNKSSISKVQQSCVTLKNFTLFWIEYLFAQTQNGLVGTPMTNLQDFAILPICVRRRSLSVVEG